MHKASAVPAQPNEEMLQPDTFWELIEKLLLHSSNDEQKRLRHNVSLSALCRGYAVSRQPRDKHPQITKSTITSKDNKKLDVSKVLKKTKCKKLQNCEKRVLVKDKSRDTNAHQSRSACSISDSDVVFVKESEIPVSERLWRFAIRNRQQQQDNESTDDDHKPIPSARSNEAIYEGLKKRLEDARTEDLAINKSKQKRKKETHKIKKHHCEKATSIDTVFVKSKSEREKSNLIPTTTVSSVRNPKRSLSKQHIESKPIVHDLRRTPVKNLIETSETAYSQVTPEHFEAKKTQYDSVLKKRLVCGNQLEMLSKAISDKKMNPRLVLSRETTKKYADLKSDYLKLCYQESSLRHQIAMLQAEIYMMAHKGFHKRPAAVKTITLDSKYAQLPQHANTRYPENEVNGHEKVLLFPRLKPPKPLLVAQQKPSYYFYDHMQTRKSVPQKESSLSLPKSASGEESFSTGFPCLVQSMSPKGVCSLYSLTASLKPPIKRQPNALLVPETANIDQIQTTHRLPKMNIPINTQL